MTTTLSAAEVEQLFAFVKKKMVYYYDLQVELVDHLASAIEEKMAADKNLHFETALASVYKDFGIFGFARVVQEKTVEVQKMSKRLVWEEVKKLFSWPVVITTLCTGILFWLAWQMFESRDQQQVFIYVIWIGSAIFGIPWYAFSRPLKKLLMLQALLLPYMFPWFYGEFLILTSEKIPADYLFAVLCIGLVFRFAAFKVATNLQLKAKQMYPFAFAK